MTCKYRQMAGDLRAEAAQEHNIGHPWDMIQDAAGMIDELTKELHNLVVAANTVQYCYENVPGRFAESLKHLQDQTDHVRNTYSLGGAPDGT